MSDPLPAITHPDLETPHAFFTRDGGTSRGFYASLNAGLGSGDDRAHVERNRAMMAGHLGVRPDRLLTPYQIHSAIVLEADAPWTGERPSGDAIVTATPGLAVGVVTADCGAVLLADVGRGVVGAAHAGWKGALAGVTDAVIDRMCALGAVRHHIVAVVGPTIAQRSYEVDDAFRQRFLAADEGNGAFFRPGRRGGHPMFDLPGYLCRRLQRAGVRSRNAGQDTYPPEARFFSYRRSTHRGEGDYGRQLSAIVLR